MRRGWALIGLVFLQAGVAAAAPELLYVSEGNRLRRLDIDTFDRGPVLEEIVVENADRDPERGRDINGMICAVPGDGALLITGEDTGQPDTPAGWGVLTGAGDQVGKLTATAFAEQAEPYGCAFTASGQLFTTEVGRQGFFFGSGQLITWFPPYTGFPGPPGAYPATAATRENYCKLAVDLGTAAAVVTDTKDRVYVATSSGGEVLRFSPPYPAGADAMGSCGGRDDLGSPLADAVQRETFIGTRYGDGLITHSGLAFAPNGHLYVASVATGRIGEFDAEGEFVRLVLEPDEWLPPFRTGFPMGLAVDAAGTLYYADLDLTLGFFSVGTGDDGKVWRIRFDADGAPRRPEIVIGGLRFPDGLAVLPGDLEQIAAMPGARVRPAAAVDEAATSGGSGAVTFVFVLMFAVLVATGWVLRRRRR